MHHHITEGAPLLVTPPIAWARQFQRGLNGKWETFLGRWDADGRRRVEPTGFKNNTYYGIGEKWLAYWRMDTEWFVAAVSEKSVNMVEEWAAECDSEQAQQVRKVIRALGELRQDSHDPARSLSPFFAHAQSPSETADLHYDTYDNITPHQITPHQTKSYHATPRHTIRYPTPPHHTTPLYNTQHHTTTHHTTPHYTTPHHTTPHLITPRHTTAHRTAPHHTAPHRDTPHQSTLHQTTPDHTTPHHTTSHHIAPHHASPYGSSPHQTTTHHAT
jgi:hypothetical protein